MPLIFHINEYVKGAAQGFWESLFNSHIYFLIDKLLNISSLLDVYYGHAPLIH